MLDSSPDVYAGVMRVLLDPAKADGPKEHLKLTFDDGTVTGLHLHRCFAVPTNGAGADLEMSATHEVWAQILGAKLNLVEARGGFGQRAR